MLRNLVTICIILCHCFVGKIFPNDSTVKVGEKVILNDGIRNGTRKVLQVGIDGTIAVLGNDGSSFNLSPDKYIPIVDRFNSLIAGLNVIVGVNGNWSEGIRKILAVGKNGTLVLLTNEGEERIANPTEYIPTVSEKNGVRPEERVIAINGREGSRKVLAVGEDGTLVFWGLDGEIHNMREFEYVPIVKEYQGLKAGDSVIVGVSGNWTGGTRKILAVGNNGLLVLETNDGTERSTPPSEYIPIVSEHSGIRAKDLVIVRNVGNFDGGTRKVIAVGKDGRIVIEGRNGDLFTIGPDVYVSPDPLAAEERRKAELEAAKKERELKEYEQRVREHNEKIEIAIKPFREALQNLEALVGAEGKILGDLIPDKEVILARNLLENAIKDIERFPDIESQVERIKRVYPTFWENFPPAIQRLFAQALSGTLNGKNEFEVGDYVTVAYKLGLPLFGRRQATLTGIVSDKLSDGRLLIVEGNHFKAAQKQRNSVQVYVARPNSVTQLLSLENYDKILSKNEESVPNTKNLSLYTQRFFESGKRPEEILRLCGESMAKIAQ